MADQKINELPTKTAPSTGDKMLMIGAAEEYQIDYDKLATAILNKLSTQSFSSLDTTSKTVLGAIDELNSKSWLLQGGTAIPENADMDTYTTPGNYYIISNTQAATLSNSPFENNAFILKVEYANGVTYPRQIFTEYSTGRKAIRFISSSGGSWSDWLYFSDDDTVLAHVISPVTMNDAVNINTGYVDLNFPLNEYFFFKFVCAGGNVSSTGNLYEENMMVGFSYHVPCGKGYIRFNIESLTRINILENTSGYNFRYIKALKK